MNITDPIARTCSPASRNASTAKHPFCGHPCFQLEKAIANIPAGRRLCGRRSGSSPMTSKGVIRIALKYTETGAPVISGIRRVSKPGLRIYTNCEDMPKVMKGLGTAIISTSKGVMTGQGRPTREQRWRRSSSPFVW